MPCARPRTRTRAQATALPALQTRWLRLPRWLVDASPVGRITAPSSVSAVAVIVLTAVAVALVAVAGLLYRRRDAA